MNHRPTLWRPAPARIPTAWRRPRASAPKLVLRVLLLLTRNAIPLAGFLLLGWSADAVVLLGGFNFGMLLSTIASMQLALATLRSANATQARLRAMSWAIATVVFTWLVVGCVAAFEPILTLYVYRTPGSWFVLDDGVVWWSALGLSAVAAANYVDDLHERRRAPPTPPPDTERKPASVLSLLVILLAEGWMLWLMWLPLVLDHGGNELGPELAVTIVVGVSLFFDALQTFAPQELPRDSSRTHR